MCFDIALISHVAQHEYTRVDTSTCHIALTCASILTCHAFAARRRLRQRPAAELRGRRDGPDILYNARRSTLR